MIQHVDACSLTCCSIMQCKRTDIYIYIYTVYIYNVGNYIHTHCIYIYIYIHNILNIENTLDMMELFYVVLYDMT